jgi:hypothetical protein
MARLITTSEPKEKVPEAKFAGSASISGYSRKAIPNGGNVNGICYCIFLRKCECLYALAIRTSHVNGGTWKLR